MLLLKHKTKYNCYTATGKHWKLLREGNFQGKCKALRRLCSFSVKLSWVLKTSARAVSLNLKTNCALQNINRIYIRIFLQKKNKLIFQQLQRIQMVRQGQTTRNLLEIRENIHPIGLFSLTYR